jgi:hypothetical protein
MMNMAKYMADYRQKNKDKLQEYSRKYYRAYRKGKKYSAKDHKSLAEDALKDALFNLKEYRNEQIDNEGIIPTLFELIKDLSTIADKFNKLTTEEDFL